MGTMVYRPDHPEANENGMVSAETAGPKHASGSACYVIGDEMPATRHMVDGKYFTSKAKFRAHTKAHGCIEVGNETSTVLKGREPIRLSREKRVEDIQRAIYELRNR